MNYLIPDRNEQLINELCKNGSLEDHRETIRAMLAEINTQGARTEHYLTYKSNSYII